MSNIFLAESKKIWKPKIVVWYLGITFSFVLLWIWAKYKPIILHSGGTSFQQAIADNQKAEGLSTAFVNLTPYFYMITVAIFASNFSREYSLHTWKNIFIYQPQRVKVIFQKCLALITFSSLIILFNFIFSLLVTLSIAGYGGINTNKWLTPKNLLHILDGEIRVTLATAFFGMLAIGLTSLIGSGKWTIAGVFLWLLVGEPLITHFFPKAEKFTINSNIDSFVMDFKWGASTWGLMLVIGLIGSIFALGNRKLISQDILG